MLENFLFLYKNRRGVRGGYQLKEKYTNNLMGISPEIAAKAISDGYHENGINPIYFDGDNNEFFCQSKWNHSGNKTAEDVETIKFTDRIRNIIEFRLDHFIEKIKKQEQELKLSYAFYLSL